MLCWLLSRLNPCSNYYLQKSLERDLVKQKERERRQEEQEAIDRQYLPTLSPERNEIRSSKPNGSVFLLDLDVREQSLREAFGDQTVHLDLDFRHPFKVLTANPKDIKAKWERYP
ncbi:unnamed protein product [Clonostachys rosea]|uniref:Uncharacterized protein n=1 Tax=Bionectria ochroleuca TaxID=29856 RepID=A0ABY6V2N4_BIOOC|nr:unnamed protein product [Clonostachys rosea]